MIYFDNAATTRVCEEALAKLSFMSRECFGNPSSLHHAGFLAEKELKEAAAGIAKILKADAEEIYFTSGGTESNNLALIGLASAYKRQGGHIVSTSEEHASVLRPLQYLSENGFSITYAEPDETGYVSPEQVVRALRADTVLLSVGHINSETGAIRPIHEISRAVKEAKPDCKIHADCVQSFGKRSVQINYLDAVSFSGHKIHAPKGVGALYLKKGVRVKPLLFGGGQQKDLRPGTENTASIAAFAAAARIAVERMAANEEAVRAVWENMRRGLLKLEGVRVNGGETSPYILNVTFEGLRGEVLLHALEEENILIATGSACGEKYKNNPSAVNKKKEEGTVRFSFCADNTVAETNTCLAALGKIIPLLRRFVKK